MAESFAGLCASDERTDNNKKENMHKVKEQNSLLLNKILNASSTLVLTFMLRTQIKERTDILLKTAAAGFRDKYKGISSTRTLLSLSH